jgi:hypothetical protein
LHECFFPQPAFAQFGGLKDIINKSKNAAKKEIEKMGGTNPNNTGTGNAPVPGASSPTADNSRERSFSVKQNKIEVDPEIVKMLQSELKTHCETVWGGRKKGLNCDCIATAYPQLRLTKLNQNINHYEGFYQSCEGNPSAQCANAKVLFELYTNADFQKVFDYPEKMIALQPKSYVDTRTSSKIRGGARRVILPHGRTLIEVFEHYSADLRNNKACWDGEEEAKEVEATCMTIDHNLTPGKSKKEFCACLATKVRNRGGNQGRGYGGLLDNDTLDCHK